MCACVKRCVGLCKEVCRSVCIIVTYRPFFVVSEKIENGPIPAYTFIEIL